MPLEDPDTIDLMATTTDGKPLLVITDAGLSRSDEERFEKLVAKLTSYVTFVMSEDFASRFPESRPSDATIEVVCADPPTEQMTKIGSIAPRGDQINRITVRYTHRESRI